MNLSPMDPETGCTTSKAARLYVTIMVIFDNDDFEYKFATTNHWTRDNNTFS